MGRLIALGRLMALVACLGVLLGCEGDGAGREPLAEAPPEVLDFYEQLLLDAEAFEEIDGEWTEDYGDAPFYGLALYARLADERDSGSYRSRAERAKAYDLSVVEQANADRDWYLENMEEALMAALGLVEHAAQTGDASTLPSVEGFIDETNELVGLFGDYLPNGADIGSFALETYGPTTITAAAALLDLQYATYLDTDRRQERIDRAAQIVRAVDRRAWDGERYLFAPGNDGLYLYPNVMMMLVQLRLHELTDDRAHLDRAEQIALGIEPLKDGERGGYHSPYSAEHMGAETDDYSTLSSQNYLTMALLLLYRQTRDRRWFDEAMGVVEFVQTRLYDPDQGRVLHHWMDGRIAQPDDLEYFCSGCNLQLLYVLWTMQAVVLTE